MRVPTDLLSAVFRSPQRAQNLSLGDWDVLIRQARRAELLARLHGLLRQHALVAAVPDAARWHLEAASLLSDNRQRETRRHISQLRAILGPACPLVALKGTAYAVAGLPSADGHPLHVIDLLLPPAALSGAESALLHAGWQVLPLPPYERRYSQRWHQPISHQNLRPAATLNLHHALVADTARYRPDPALLWSNLEAAADGLLVLGREDRILHAATLLLHDDALQGGLRDLTDLDLLLRDAAADPGFWPRLTARADELQLSRPLFYALRYLRHFLETPVPGSVITTLEAAAPSRVTLALMDSIFTRVLAPEHASCADAYTPAARQAAFVRAHWLRMPAHLLIPHLFHKAFISPYQREPKPA